MTCKEVELRRLAVARKKLASRVSRSNNSSRCALSRMKLRAQAGGREPRAARDALDSVLRGKG